MGPNLARGPVGPSPVQWASGWLVLVIWARRLDPFKFGWARVHINMGPGLGSSPNNWPWAQMGPGAKWALDSNGTGPIHLVYISFMSGAIEQLSGSLSSKSTNDNLPYGKMSYQTCFPQLGLYCRRKMQL